ncbi:MAG: Fic family protein [Deltaproteobacteria bacterium]|nr:Fic family protein [Deltaproteobacteria bacterium]
MLSFELTNKITKELQDVNKLLVPVISKLKTYSPSFLDEIHHLAQVSNIGASTRIENAVLTDAEIYWIDTQLSQDVKTTTFENQQHLIFDKLSKDRERSIEEVAGCRSLLIILFEQAKDFFPLRQSDLCAFHQELLKYYPPAHYYIGQYKKVPNSVIERNSRTKEERVVFKTSDPGPLTESAMYDLLQWYNQNLKDYPWSLAFACEFVFRFLAIHPFQDGNGRLGRALFYLALLQSADEDIASICRYISVDRQIERHKMYYYHALQQCSGGIFQQDPKNYKIEFFLKFMMKMFRLALEDVEVYSKKILMTQELPEASLKVYGCFKNNPERKLQTGELISHTELPRRTVINSLNRLLEDKFIQSYGQASATRYQIIF